MDREWSNGRGRSGEIVLDDAAPQGPLPAAYSTRGAGGLSPRHKGIGCKECCGHGKGIPRTTRVNSQASLITLEKSFYSCDKTLTQGWRAALVSITATAARLLLQGPFQHRFQSCLDLGIFLQRQRTAEFFAFDGKQLLFQNA